MADLAAVDEADAQDGEARVDPPPVYRGSGFGFRTRLTLALIAAAVLPVAGFGIVFLLVTGMTESDTAVARVLLLAIAVSVVFAVLLAALLAADLGAPLRAIARSVDQVSAGEDPGRLELPGDDEFSRLAESHNRLARDLGRRNRELRQIVVALEATSLLERPDAVVRRAADQARVAFGMIDCALLLVDPREIPTEETVPGDPVPVRADLVASGEQLGVVVGHLPATRHWERADQDLFELFAIEVSAAIRNAQLYARVEDQNRRLVDLDEAKDDFLRGVSHNLQTPLASIRGYAQQLAMDSPDRRLGIITEQADRLSRMVRQLLTVSRIESGALRPRVEVVSPAARVRRTWEALGVEDVPFSLDDGSAGWLALADGDQLDQVLWALLDNAVVYGGRIRDRGHDHGRRGGRRPRRHHRGPRQRHRRGGSRTAVPALRARLGEAGRRGQRPGALRLARAVPGDERRPRPRAVGRGIEVPRSRSTSRRRRPKRAEGAAPCGYPIGPCGRMGRVPGTRTETGAPAHR